MKNQLSDFSARLQWAGRILEDPDHYVWCCSPIMNDDGLIHVFYSRWPREAGFRGWLTDCEICRAVSKNPEGPYQFQEVVLRGRCAGLWDASSVHNPSIKKVDGRYYLFHIGTRAGRDWEIGEALKTKRVGLAVADNISGPWTRFAKPLIDVGANGEWDDFMTSNPAFIRKQDGTHVLYYKAMDEKSWINCRGNRKYGFATATDITGPYIKHKNNPVVDYSHLGEKHECEDAFLFFENGSYHMLLRDMGVFGEKYGMILRSEDCISWSQPQIGYLPAEDYVNEAPVESHRAGRFERPQLLFDLQGNITHLFVAFAGGRHGLSSGAVLKVLPSG